MSERFTSKRESKGKRMKTKETRVIKHETTL